MTKSIIDFWPFPYEPRKNQVAALNWLAENSDAKHLILELPVGSGKSNIGITYSRYIAPDRGNSFILTPQRILQEQYETSFEGNSQIDLYSFYGKTNYDCATKKSNCEIGGMLKPECSACPFKAAKSRARRSANTVLNYKLAMVSFGYTQTFKARPLMIFDECHSLENHLVDFDAVGITERRSNKYKLPFEVKKSMDGAMDWVKAKYLPALTPVVDRLLSECEYILDKESKDVTQAEVQKVKDTNSLLEHRDQCDEIVLTEKTELADQFVLIHEPKSFAFKRLYGSYTFHGLLMPKAEQMLYMSSTILNKPGFCKDLGIKQEDTAFLSLPSEFAVENRPVFFMPHMKMNVSWSSDENKKQRDKLIDSIKTILNIHKDESGIIHTGNFQIAKWLVQELDGKVTQRVYHHNPDSGEKRGDVIQAYMNDAKPAVLISPSITEGLDLKDDLGRFAMIIKVPFGHLGDQWIKRRMEISSEWYQRQALIDIIQGGGRIVRGPEDKGVVYILDGSWAYLMQSTSYMIPKWWREAYKAVG